MDKNIIFVFSGTGNSLWAAKKIADALGNCEIFTMGQNSLKQLPSGYDRIGFVYPTYAGGMPKRVKEFISDFDLGPNKNAYFFAIATCGRISRAQNVITQMRHLLKRQDILLSYGERLDMFSNYVIGYEMRETVHEEAAQSALDLEPMIIDIKKRQLNDVNAKLTPRQLTSLAFMLAVPHMDKNFNISPACTSCGICEKVCPMKNIFLNENGTPSFKHQCEQCLACIQCCPSQAINYKNKTQGKRRYIHPDISWQDISQLNIGN